MRERAFPLPSGDSGGRRSRWDRSDEKAYLGHHSLCTETASSRKGEDFVGSLHQLLGSAEEEQMAVVHAVSNTIGKASQGEGRVGER